MMLILDGNVLAALMLRGHLHHHRANAWFAGLSHDFATCSVTEGTFLRLSLRLVVDSSAADAWQVLARFQSHPNHLFIDDGCSYQQVSHRELTGHKQVTDAWLTQLARKHGAQLATFDAGLVATHPDVGFMIP
jgi:toxin-antitoxin system PIN domain toxin